MERNHWKQHVCDSRSADFDEIASRLADLGAIKAMSRLIDVNAGSEAPARSDHDHPSMRLLQRATAKAIHRRRYWDAVMADRLAEANRYTPSTPARSRFGGLRDLVQLVALAKSPAGSLGH